jgi:PKD repeat protein
MYSRWNGAFALILVGLVALCASCSGGSSDPGEVIGEKFDLLITANPDSGPSPLTVSFFAVPSGGQEPYSYRWDFNNDRVAVQLNNGIFSYTASRQATVP